MNQHTKISRPARKPAAATKRAAPAKLQSIADSARKTAGSVSRASAKAAEPLLASLKQEKPETLSKMAIAALAPALAPKLAVAALRFAMRNPLVIVASAITFAAVAVLTDEDGEQAAA